MEKINMGKISDKLDSFVEGRDPIYIAKDLMIGTAYIAGALVVGSAILVVGSAILATVAPSLIGASSVSAVTTATLGVVGGTLATYKTYNTVKDTLDSSNIHNVLHLKKSFNPLNGTKAIMQNKKDEVVVDMRTFHENTKVKKLAA